MWSMAQASSVAEAGGGTASDEPEGKAPHDRDSVKDGTSGGGSAGTGMEGVPLPTAGTFWRVR
jgi:hypothetical protein